MRYKDRFLCVSMGHVEERVCVCVGGGGWLQYKVSGVGGLGRGGRVAEQVRRWPLDREIVGLNRRWSSSACSFLHPPCSPLSSSSPVQI